MWHFLWGSHDKGRWMVWSSGLWFIGCGQLHDGCLGIVSLDLVDLMILTLSFGN